MTRYIGINFEYGLRFDELLYFGFESNYSMCALLIK
jgi:hypothetical protein